MSPKESLTIAARMPKPRVEARLRAIEEAAEAKGNGLAGVPVPPVAEPTGTTGKGTKASPRVLKNGTRTRGTTVHVPVELARRLGVFCATRDLKQNDVWLAAIAAYLDVDR